MSRGPGKWQSMILEAMKAAGDLDYVVVTQVGTKTFGRSMSRSEYRALNRAAHLLRDRGALHLGRLSGADYRGNDAIRLVAWTCAKCSLDAGCEHIPALPCLYCKQPTQRRAKYRADVAQCQECDDRSTADSKLSNLTSYPVPGLDGSTLLTPVLDALIYRDGKVELRVTEEAS